MRIETESSHHESGPGQNEIVFIPSDPLRSADNLLTFKNIVSVIANRNGLSASFLPKPLANKSGNGLHINISLYKNDENLAGSNTDSVSENFMAGVFIYI